MFEKARVKLTAWYLAIIMAVSLLFSLLIYTGINRELTQFERAAQRRAQLEEQGIIPRLPFRPNPNIDLVTISQARARLISVLILINIGIGSVATVAGYFLAGKTLRPIKEMVEGENRFIADASHELRTPLTSLRLETEVALRNRNLTLSETKDLLTSNLEEIANLQALSESLIKLTRYQSANNFVFAKGSLRSVAGQAEKKVRGVAKKKGVDLKNDLPDLVFDMERDSLVELLVILLDNAIKYSLEKSSVFISALKTDSHVQIKVEDHGIGIAEKDIPHLFDRFYRGDKSRTKADVGGYGLGLAIAKEIVERHHGVISVQSQLGQSTTFSIRIPLEQPKS